MKKALPFRLPAPEAGSVDVLIIAGEHSGDQHAATMARQLKAAHPELKLAALGGPALSREGVQVLYDLTVSSVVGIVEVLKNFSFFKALFCEMIRWIEEYKPRAVCFVDYPGFNLRLAAELHKRGISVKGGGAVKMLYYISPQIWAWKAKRRFAMARHLDALAVIFPFEVACYADTDLPVEFVGHPFLEEEHESPVRYDPGGPVLLLPGSRKQAVSRIFPVVLAGYQANKSNTREAVVLYPTDAIKEVLLRDKLPPRVRLVKTGEGQVAASAVLTSSGTMQMHCALAGIPGAIAYRTNPLTYLLARILVKISHIGISNILLKTEMYPEYVQGAATPQVLARELDECLGNAERIAKTREQTEQLRAILSHPADASAAMWLARKLAEN